MTTTLAKQPDRRPGPGRGGDAPARVGCGGARPRGFSLIELLVAVAIFALASAIAWTGLSSVAQTKQDLGAAQARFASVQRSVNLLARDLRTAVDRGVRVGRSGRRAALVGDARRLTLTRIGAASQLRARDSALQRVLWFIDDDRLVRGRYAVLDRLGLRSLQRRTMAEDIRGLRLRYLGRGGGWHDHWPPDGGDNADAIGLPRAVEFRIDFASLGEIRRIVELPSAAAVAPAAPSAPEDDAP